MFDIENLSLKAYKTRLNFLAKEFVNPAIVFEEKNPTAIAPDYIIDLVRAYVVLVYAETEELVEILSLSHLNYLTRHLEWLKIQFSSGRKFDKPTRIILVDIFPPLFHADEKKKRLSIEIIDNKLSQNKETYAKLIDSMINSLKNTKRNIFNNNGLNSTDIDKLFDKNGFETATEFFELRNDLNILTFKRCRFAHTGKVNPDSEIQKNMPCTISIGYIPRATEEIKNTQKIFNYLEKLVHKLKELPILYD